MAPKFRCCEHCHHGNGLRADEHEIACSLKGCEGSLLILKQTGTVRDRITARVREQYLAYLRHMTEAYAVRVSFPEPVSTLLDEVRWSKLWVVYAELLQEALDLRDDTYVWVWALTGWVEGDPMPKYAKVPPNDVKPWRTPEDTGLPGGSALPIHRTEAGWPRCSTCDGGGCLDCTDPA